MDLILRQISNGSDEKAFRQFIKIYADRLYQFAFSFLKKRQLAEEVVSDVFFKVWLNRGNISSIENIKAYLYKATYNTVLNYLSYENRKRSEYADDFPAEIYINPVCPETELINKELKELIDLAVEALPSRCKLIYKLAKIDELKYKEIALLLGISVKTIDNQIAIALKKIGREIILYLESFDENM